MKDEKVPFQNKLKDFFIKFGLSLLIACGGFACAALIVILQKPWNVKQNLPASNKPLLSQNSDFQLLRLEIQSLSSKFETLQALYQKSEKQIQGLEAYCRALEKSVQELAGENQKIQNYLSNIYKRMIDIDMQIDSIGGGFSPPRSSQRPVNPFLVPGIASDGSPPLPSE